MVTKYKFCHYTFSDGSRVTNVVRNYFCQEIFLQIKFRPSVTNFFITECLFSCSDIWGVPVHFVHYHFFS